MEQINRAIFYAAFRSWFKRLRGRGMNEQEIAGMNFLLARAERDADWWRAPKVAAKSLAYFFATVAHESGFTFQPIREGLGSASRNPHLYRLQDRYWPSHSYNSNDAFGRGYVQITWRENYEKADRKLALGGSLAANPNRALEPEIAYLIAARGMREGWFTAGRHRLAMYVNDQVTDYRHARQIVNLMDKADEIAAHAAALEIVLRSAIAGAANETPARELEVAPLAPDAAVEVVADDDDSAFVALPSGDGDARGAGGSPVPPAPASVTRPEQTIIIPSVAPRKERSVKALLTMIGGGLATIGVPFTFVGDSLKRLLDSGNPQATVLILGVILAVTAIICVYLNRQTQLDKTDRNNATQLNSDQLRYAADRESNTVQLSPSVTPAPPQDAATGEQRDAALG